MAVRPRGVAAADPVRATDPSPTTAASRAPELATRERPRADRWQELTSLILSAERERLNEVERKLDDRRIVVDEVSHALPDAIRRRGKDRALGDALGPVVGDAIKSSVRRDPQPLVDAIFPIIGPAIRRAISAAFAELVQSMNSTLEHSFSPRGLGWRVEAMRTGRSFGEVVLRHSLLFRVEQLFLVHRETGLIVTHLTAPGITALSPGMVAAMLTAITDFARDSFAVSPQEGLDSMALGDLTVWVEDGPAVALAAVIRGHAPLTLRQTMKRAVEGVQRAHAAELEVFGKQGAPFAVQPELLEPCLASQESNSRQPSRWRLGALAVVILLGAGWCTVPRVVEGRRFDKLVTALRQEPGVVVGSTGRMNGRWVISGLRDPLARDPAVILAAAGLDSARVVAHWEPYVALRPEFVLRRAGAALRPPATVQLVMHGDTLGASGIASEAWLSSTRRIAGLLSGVGAVDLIAVRDSAQVAMRAFADQLEQLEVSFDRGATFPTATSRPAVDAMVAGIRDLTRDAAVALRHVSVEVQASTDSVGLAATNTSLRAARAGGLRSLLIARGAAPEQVTASADSSRRGRQASLRITIRALGRNPS